MIETWSAVRFEEVKKGGTTKPLVLNCLCRAEGSVIPERKRFVVKCMDLPRISPRVMFCEIVGNLFAREIEVNTPRPALVSISDTFARVTNAILARDGLQISEGGWCRM